MTIWWSASDTRSLPGNVGFQKKLLRREVIHRNRTFKQRIIERHYGNSRFSDNEVLGVLLRVIADHGAFGDMHVAVNNGSADTAMAADVHVRKNDARVY